MILYDRIAIYERNFGEVWPRGPEERLFDPIWHITSRCFGDRIRSKIYCGIRYTRRMALKDFLTDDKPNSRLSDV